MLLSILLAIAVQSGAELTREIEFYNPDWSPDSRSLVFESTLDGKFSIYVISRDGSGLRRLTADSSNNEQPRWSPDGRRIVFSSDRGGHLDLYVMNADGSNLTRLTTTPSGGYYQASFSPDGRWILFQGRSDTRETRDHVYLMPGDGSGSWRLLSDSGYGAQGPRWSKDGKSVTFSQVAWPKRSWNEMTPETMAAARRETKAVTVRLDGTVISSRSDPQSTTPPDEKITAPDGRFVAYTKSVDGFQGLYVDDRLILGGPAAGPLGYLRSTSLTPTVDTIDTFTSEIGGAPQRGSGTYVIHVIRFARGGRWEIVDNWYDSTGHETARQATLTAPRRLMTELETVRADGDSASMLITRDHVTAWVVPSGAGATPRLYDGTAVGERYTGAAVAAAVAKTRGAIGSTFRYPAYTLFGGSPVASRVDSIRIVGRDTLHRGATSLPVVVVQRSNGGQLWMDETTGNEVASRGNAGPGRWWWHVRRGVTPPPASQTP
ncbi:MAG TPA: hypothetical protein VKD28_08650 [Gemmatimonadales bacterium]|nr:hypothetical protein [Gemmatimonadales bacterium]